MQIFANPNYDFLKWRFHAIAISVLFILAGAAMYFVRGANVGIDFAGGASVILRFQEQVPLDQIRSIVSGATIQQYGRPEENSVILDLPQAKEEGDYAGRVVTLLNERLNQQTPGKIDLNLVGRDRITEILTSADPDRKGAGAATHYSAIAQNVIARRSELGIFRSMEEVRASEGLTAASGAVLSQNAILGRFNVLSQETVGPAVGRELQTKAVWAIVLATLAMGIYIAIRFDLTFGVAAIICLVHDVFIGLAFLIMSGGEFEIITVAALLMIIGYSINDTVVIYDRVRENLRKARSTKPGEFEAILNRSLNQTLSRTILTGGSVLLVLVCLIIFGGEVINDFAWLLLIGIIAGTFSTLTVVPAIVIAWNRRKADLGVAAVRETTPEKSRRAKA